MTLEAAYLVAGIVSALGVIASLIFVGVQLRGQKSEAQIAGELLIQREMRDRFDNMNSDPERLAIILRCYEKGCAQENDLNMMTFVTYSAAWVHLWNQAWQMHQQGRLRDDTLHTVEQTMLANFTTPGGLDYWRNWGTIHGPGFGAYGEAHIARVTERDTVSRESIPLRDADGEG
ncbi:MAG: hypothetical protein WBA35_00810 [Litorimonas sp.]